jgi:glycosyltransferase involved in cell wall biosynthesis
MKQKIAIVTNMITPYRIPLFNYISKQPDVNLKIIALTKKEANREWKIAYKKINFNYQILSGWHSFLWKKEFPLHLNWGLWKSLKKHRTEIIITSGYSNFAYWQAFLYSKIFKKKFILWSGTTLLSVEYKNSIIKFFKKLIAQKADCCVSYGKKATEYLNYLGVPNDKIFTGLNTVNLNQFRKKVFKLIGNKRFKKKRSKFPKILLLYVGQLVERKALIQVLKALKKNNDQDIGLLIIGSGPRKKFLKKVCLKNNLKNIYFEGFKQPDQLDYYYALADAFILPSFKEVWGLVINEALASGLYTLASDKTGASYDLIQPKINGEIFNPEKVDEICQSIKKLKANIEKIRNRREKISNYALKNFAIVRYAKAFLEAINCVSQ